jgi:hypothetical protein
VTDLPAAQAALAGPTAEGTHAAIRDRERVAAERRSSPLSVTRAVTEWLSRSARRAGTVLAHWTGSYATDISRSPFDERHSSHATSCRTSRFSQVTGLSWEDWTIRTAPGSAAG